jgi:hypothetical protein
LRLVAPDLVLQRIDALLALQIFDLLLLAQRIGLALDPVDLLIRLEPLELLVVSVLIKLELRLAVFRWLRPDAIAALRFLLVELLLCSQAFLIPFEVFELLLALGGFGLFFLARFGLFLKHFFDLARSAPTRRTREYQHERRPEGYHSRRMGDLHIAASLRFQPTITQERF